MKLLTTAGLGMGATSVIGFVAAQVPTGDTAAWLQAYGPWAGLVAVSGVCSAIAKAYVDQRNKHDKALEELNAKHAVEKQELNDKLVALLGNINKTLTEMTQKRISGPTKIEDNTSPGTLPARRRGSGSGRNDP